MEPLEDQIKQSNTEQPAYARRAKFSTMVSIKEAAKMLGISYSTFHRLTMDGKIQQVQISARRKVIPLEAIEAYIQNCYNQAA